MITARCCIIGDDCVGKTCLLITNKEDIFPSDFVPTICDEYSSEYYISNTRIVLQFYDTTNEHEQLRPFLYENIDVFIICFSLVSPSSLKSVQSTFIPEVKNTCPNKPYILVGTKSDLRDNFSQYEEKFRSRGLSPILREEGEKMKKQIQAQDYIECSSLKNKNIKMVFESAANALIHPQESKQEDS